MRIITQSDLSSKQAKGAKIKRPAEPPSAEPPSAEPPIPEPTPQPVMSDELVTSTLRLEQTITKTLAVADENASRLTDSIQQALEAMSKERTPIAYDLIIKRDPRTGLLSDRIRIQPVRET